MVNPQALAHTRLLLDPASTNHGWNLAQRYVSVGCLPYPHIDSGRISNFSKLRIDSSPTTLIKAGLNKDNRVFLILLEEHPWHRNSTQSYCIEVALGDGRRLIVPCIELSRFYFGFSSSLVSKLFLSPLSEENSPGSRSSTAFARNQP